MYDAVIVGGGLAGATLARELALAGLSILVLEKEAEFRDRVRGEVMLPWGIAEARRLGIYELLKESCAREVRLIEQRVAGAPPEPLRDLVETTPHAAGSLHFQHVEMQRVLLAAAEEAGAEVRRPASVISLNRTPSGPVLDIGNGHGGEEVSAKLVIGADGRRSLLRNFGGFAVSRDPDRTAVAGVLMKGMSTPDDRAVLLQNFETGRISVIVPLPDDHYRAYVCYRKGRSEPARPLSGERALPDFIAMSVEAGAPPRWYDGAEQVGPLASFDGADTWVEHPYKEGVVLVGDAAASNDPSFGCGLSLTLRSVRMLRDHLLANEDWDAAAEAYAVEQTSDAAALRRITGWLTDLTFEGGEEAEARRGIALGRLAEDPTRLPDFVGLGPDAPSDETARQRLFGEV